MELLVAAGLLAIQGIFAGFSAGLLGIGGGAVLVPGLYYILKHFGFSDVAMHVAVGTSLLTIIFTGTSSALAHHRRGAVDVPMLKKFLPGVVIGVLIGTYLSDLLPTEGLKIIFAGSQLVFGTYMILRTNKTNLVNDLPKQPYLSVFAALNAGLATMMGVGGGVQNVTFMTICNVGIHNAIATARPLALLLRPLARQGL